MDNESATDRANRAEPVIREAVKKVQSRGWRVAVEGDYYIESYATNKTRLCLVGALGAAFGGVYREGVCARLDIRGRELDALEVGFCQWRTGEAFHADAERYERPEFVALGDKLAREFDPEFFTEGETR